METSQKITSKKIDYDQYIFYVFSFELQTLSLTYNTLNFIKKDQL